MCENGTGLHLNFLVAPPFGAHAALEPVRFPETAGYRTTKTISHESFVPLESAMTEIPSHELSPYDVEVVDNQL